MELIREACVETKAELDNALKHRADQIELCSQLDLGGLTPDGDLIQYAMNKSKHILIMVRNHSGYRTNFCDTLKLLKTIKKYRRSRVQGFVFGFLRNGSIDEKTVHRLVKASGDKETVFHMAFDEISNQELAIDTLVKLGVTRILTKGGKHGPAIKNTQNLKKLMRHANGRIQIIVGGNVTDDNYISIATSTKIDRFHGRKLAFT